MTRLIPLVALVLAVSPAAAQDPNFDGLFLSVVKKSNPQSSVDIEKVALRTIGGKPFLVGTGADTPGNWQKGKTVMVSVDDVSEITVFATLDELRKAGAEEEKKQAGGR